MKETPKLESPLVICGLPGAALVGKVALDHLVQELGAKLLAEVHCGGLAPEIFVEPDGTISVLKNEIYYCKGHGKAPGIILYTGDSQPDDPETEYFLSDAVLEYLLKEHHAIAIDLWHLLERPSDVASFLFEKALKPSGRLTISLHKQVSEKNMEVWHRVRQEIREQIASMLKERYPKVEFEGRSKGAVVHEHDTESFRSDLESVGFKLVASAEDKRLADVNQLVKHLPESFRMEVRQKIPDIDQDLLESVVADSVAHVTKSHRGIERITLATEAFFVFAKPA